MNAKLIELLQIILRVSKLFPDLRLGQIFALLNIIEYTQDEDGGLIVVDPYHANDGEVLQRVNKALKNKRLELVAQLEERGE